MVLKLILSALLICLIVIPAAQVWAGSPPPDGGGSGVVGLPISVDPGDGDEDDNEEEWLDFDFDGLPDDWEEANGLDFGDPTDADLDADEDRLSNREEYEFGSDPQLADSDEGGARDFTEWVISTAIEQIINAVLTVFSPPIPIDGIGDGESLGGSVSEIHKLMQLGSFLVTTDQKPDGDEVTDEDVDTDGTAADDETDSEKVTMDSGENESQIIATSLNEEDDSVVDEDVVDEDVDDDTFDPTTMDPDRVMTALGNLGMELGVGFDPVDDSDDEVAMKVRSALRKAGLWRTTVAIAKGEIDLVGWLMSLLQYQPPGRPPGPFVNDKPRPTSTTAQGTNSTGTNSGRTTGASKGGSSADNGGGSVGGGGSSGGQMSAGGGGSGGSGGSGGGAMGGMSGGQGGSGSYAARAMPVGSSSKTFTGTAPVTGGSRATDADNSRRGDQSHGGGPLGSALPSTIKIAKSTVTAAAPASSSTGVTSMLVVSIGSVVGFLLRRVLALLM